MRTLRVSAVISSLIFAGSLLPITVASAQVVPAWQVVGAPSNHVAGNRVIAPAAGSATIDFRVGLTPRHGSALSALAVSVANPASPNYHHFLTPSQFLATYAPTASTVHAVAAYFRNFGLHVSSTVSDGLILHVKGSLDQTAAALHTHFDAVRSARGVLGVANATDLVLPSSLAASIQGISGLDTAARAFSNLSHPHSAVSAPTSCAAADTAEATRQTHGLAPTPADQAAVYGLNAQYAAGFSGAGRSIGVLEFAGYNTSDVNFYLSCYGLSTTVSTVNIDGGPDASTLTNGESMESDLDIEEAAVLAPGSNIINYQSANTLNAFIDVFAKVAQDDAVSSLSVSWGICENQASSASYQPVLEQLAAEGIPVLVAAGDSGSEECASNAAPGGHADYSLTVDDPANSPWVTAIGGLKLNSFTPGDATVWNSICGGGVPCGGGGGMSTVYDHPVWQTGDGVDTSLAGRQIPDISVMGDPRTGFMVYYNGKFSSIGGTSIGAPIVAAMVSVAAEACGVSGVGFMNPRLYQMGQDGTGILDITTGSNDMYGTGGYSATTGYDMASGLGTPDASTFLPALCGASGSSSATPNTAGEASNWSVTIPTGTHAISAGTQITVKLLNSSTAILPTSTSAYSINGTSAVASVSNGIVTLTTPADIAANSTIALGITGAQNSAIAGAVIVEVTDPSGYLQVGQILTGAPHITSVTNDAPSKISLGAESTITLTALDGTTPVRGQSILASTTASNLVIIDASKFTDAAGHAILHVAGSDLGRGSVTVSVGPNTVSVPLNVTNGAGSSIAKFIVTKGDSVLTTGRPASSANCGVVALTKKGHLASTLQAVATGFNLISGVASSPSVIDGPNGVCVAVYVSTSGSLVMAFHAAGAKTVSSSTLVSSGVAKVAPGIAISGVSLTVDWLSTTGHLNISTSVSPPSPVTTTDLTAATSTSNLGATGRNLQGSLAISGSATVVSVINGNTAWAFASTGSNWTATDLSVNAGYTNSGKAALTGNAAVVSTNTAGGIHDFIIATHAANGHVVIFNPSPDQANYWFVNDVTGNISTLTTTADIALFDNGVPTAAVITKSGVSLLALPSPFPAPWIAIPVKVSGAKATFASATQAGTLTSAGAVLLHL